MSGPLTDQHRVKLESLGAALAACQAELAAVRARAEEDRERHQRHAAIIDASRDAIWSWDIDGNITSWNAEAERLLGYAAGEIIGKPLLSLIPPDRLQRARDVIGKLKAGGWFGQYETMRLRKDGTPVQVELTVSPILNAAGEVVGAATVCRDVTERGKAADMLARRMDELTTLYNFTDRLYRAASLADVYAAAIEAIRRALRCERASILRFDDRGVMRFVAWHGLSDAYRDGLEGHSPWKPGDRNAEPILIADIDETDEPAWVKTAIRNEGICALAFVPVVARGAVIGKFMVYDAQRRVFSEHEKDLALTIARQVGFSLERIDAETARAAVERELRESETRFRLMSESAPVMIWMSDANGACLHLNRMLREFWGVTDADLADFNWKDTMHPEDAAAIAQEMMAALAARTSVTIKGRYRRAADGRFRVLQTDARPRISAAGEFLGMIGVNVDITEREEAEAALRESEERFRLAVDAAPSGMIMTDPEGRIVMVNGEAERLFGYGRDALIGEKIEMLVPERFRPAHPGHRDGYTAHPSARPMGAGRDLFALHKDGREIPVEIGLSPFRTSRGLMALTAVVDISARKRDEAHRDLLIAELNHRVKNSLAVIQSIANQTFKGDRATPEAKAAFEGRLIALACAHDLLTRSSWESAALTDLATDTLQAQAVNKQRISIAGPPVLLKPRSALALAMAFHELSTNAAKYGALSSDAGLIDVSWTKSEGPQPRLTLVWREQGGPPVAPPARRGFGSLLLERMLAVDLEGEVSADFRPDGLICTISAPLEKTGVDPAGRWH